MIKSESQLKNIDCKKLKCDICSETERVNFKKNTQTCVGDVTVSIRELSDLSTGAIKALASLCHTVSLPLGDLFCIISNSQRARLHLPPLLLWLVLSHSSWYEFHNKHHMEIDLSHSTSALEPAQTCDVILYGY